MTPREPGGDRPAAGGERSVGGGFMGGLRRGPRLALVWLIELYRSYISPMRLPICRFDPTCSAYAVEAITSYGVLRGGGMAIIRLLKCAPWHPGGYDPVPERRKDSADPSTSGLSTASAGRAAHDPTISHSDMRSC